MMTEAEAARWRPELIGWADDILPYYERVAAELPDNAVIAEVGVCFGRSAIFLAEQLVARGKVGVQVFAVDWWTGPRFREQLLWSLRSGLAAPAEIDMLRIVACEGGRAARLFDDASVDFAFIDSDHERVGMLDHLRAWAPKVKPGGIIAGHDCDEPDWPGVRQAVDEYFGAGRVSKPTRSVWEMRGGAR